MTTLETNTPATSDSLPEAKGNACRTGMCSVGLMKSGCPTCLVLGLAMLPFEFVFRKFKGGSAPTPPTNH